MDRRTDWGDPQASGERASHRTIVWPLGSLVQATFLLLLTGTLSCGDTGLQALGPDAAVAEVDGGAPQLDAGADGGARDAGDAGEDAGGTDAGGTDAGSDAGGTDAGPGPGSGPPYPIVLAHGFFGFNDFAGAGFLSYFYKVKDRLLADGESEVFTPSVDPFNNSAVRGAELEAAVEEILRQTGAAKVNLIAHSQGGLDARVVAHDHPEWVASVTTISTPHRGSKLADIVLGLVSDPKAQSLVDQLVRLLGAPLWDAVGKETSVMESLRQLSVSGASAFNDATPDDPRVLYFSIAGRSDRHLARSLCRLPSTPRFLRVFENERDPIDPMLDLAEMLLDGGLGDPYPNDGLVRIVDARWGRFLGCIPADHLDEIGQLAGDRPGLFNSWRHLDFYSDLVSWLRTQGL